VKKGATTQFIVSFLFFCLMVGGTSLGQETDTKFLGEREKEVVRWRQERDEFFKTHQRSPLTPEEKKKFSHLHYYPFNPLYVFTGKIERYSLNINNPKYYATFLTNKGTNKRYIRYGRFHFSLDGKGHTIEVYKSILSDSLFIPFKDQTNGRDTYEGWRYIETEIETAYQMILDFNKAYYPTCAYNEKFVCALPPKENMYDFPIPAGERDPR
jgi:uncharacterized protein (DUF1684 family)